tara:strand:- start:909 stop:1478 length:570 start_codon:yes stop_codon:yes gene_type:complete
MISGSHFTKYISYNSSWIQELKKHNYVVKNSSLADLNILLRDCQQFVNTCQDKFPNPKIGVMGISSGGYFALRLKKMISRLQFCIGVAPVINPQRRKQLLQQLPSSKLTPKLKQVIRATPSVRKIYNKIDSETLIIASRRDIQVPLEIFNEYQIPNLVILEKQDHSITQQVNLELMTKINQFLTEVNQP